MHKYCRINQLNYRSNSKFRPLFVSCDTFRSFSDCVYFYRYWPNGPTIKLK